MLDIKPGDLVTLKGMSRYKEKPIGMVKRKWAVDTMEVFWLNEDISRRFALDKIVDPHKLEIISQADQ